MPIPTDELERNFVLLSPSHTVAQAIDEIEERGGDSYWFVIVRDGDVFRAERLDRFWEYAGADIGEFWALSLGDLGLPMADAVERDEVSFAEARDRAYESQARVLVVLEGGEPVGLVSVGTRGTGVDLIALRRLGEGGVELGAGPIVGEDVIWAGREEWEGGVTEEEEGTRYLNARFSESPDSDAPFFPADRTLQIGKWYYLKVFISPRFVGLGARTEAVFASDEILPFEVGELELVVAIDSSDFDVGTVDGRFDFGRLRLAERGSSNVLAFRVRPREAGMGVIGVSVFYLGNMVMHTKVAAVVAESEDVKVGAQDAKLYFARTRTFSADELNRDLSERRWTIRYDPPVDSTDARVVFYRFGDGKEAAYITDVTLQNVDRFTTLAREYLAGIARVYRRARRGDPETMLGLLGDLALVGREFYLSLLAEGRSLDLRFDDRLQVASSTLSGIPWGAVYERYIDRRLLESGNVRLCPAFEAGEGHDGGECPVADDGGYLCPEAFWGYRYAVEQVPGSVRDPLFPDPDDPMEFVPYIRREILNQDVLVLALNYYHFEGVERHKEGLRRDVVPGSLVIVEADDVEEVHMALAGRLGPGGGELPHLVHFYVHGLEEYGSRVLVVGSEEAPGTIGLNELRSWEDVDLGERNPLIVITGCGTAAYVKSDYVNLVKALMRMGACGVVATECTVYEPAAEWYARNLLRDMFRGSTVSEAMLSNCRYLMRNFNPFGLVYSLYSSADVKLAMPIL